METLGKHLIIDLWQVRENLTFNKNLVDDLIYLLKDLDQTILDWVIHEFKNDAYTLVFLLGESHLSIHTWPESNYVALDFFTCNPATDMEKATEKFVNFFKARVDHNCFMERGKGLHEGMKSKMSYMDINT